MYYENIFIVNPDISQENTETFTDTLISRVEKAGGRIVKREYWGVRPLAYSIAKRRRGHYTLLVVDGEARAAKELEQVLGLDENVLRFLTTRLNELSDAPSPLMRRKTGEEKKDATQPEDESSSEGNETPVEKTVLKADANETTGADLETKRPREDLSQEESTIPASSEPAKTETAEKDAQG